MQTFVLLCEKVCRHTSTCCSNPACAAWSNLAMRGLVSGDSTSPEVMNVHPQNVGPMSGGCKPAESAQHRGPHSGHPQPCNTCMLQDELKCTYFLWQLFHIDQDIAKGQKSLEKEEKEQAAAARSGMVVEKQIEDKKKEHAGCNLQRVKLERQLKRKRTDADQKVKLQRANMWAWGLPFS